ncbi:hypothetical protein Trichorick_00519 [Candidatus Trichorickettsia mobilis]|uniref:Flagellin N-terminal domain-containing protein n=1 Tax=Candidatus Trichorickettsia mobilis TaxID=1346319 RepID=A0ABZ0US40_9RICK|nr:hypothetical protein [Candidatus Trichorickettsia mobilis]WPY00636.1 hypothetical protein Trichorick_00519 [Candidatus Trichorickettsia mobilis]
MVSFINPVNNHSGYAVKIATIKLRDSGERMATGDRSKASIVDYIVGSQLRNNVPILKSLGKNIAYGINMLTVARSILLSSKQLLIKIQDIIAQANTVNNPIPLIALNDLYLLSITDLNRQFITATFDGRNLFDAADLTSVSVAPMDVRVNILMNDVIRITTPDLSLLTTGLGAPTDILTPINQANAQNIIADPNQANDSVDKFVINGLSMIGGQIERLKNALSVLMISTQVHDSTARDYLNTNYEDDANNFKAALELIKSSIMTIVLADQLIEEAGKLLS